MSDDTSELIDLARARCWPEEAAGYMADEHGWSFEETLHRITFGDLREQYDNASRRGVADLRIAARQVAMTGGRNCANQMAAIKHLLEQVDGRPNDPEVQRVLNEVRKMTPAQAAASARRKLGERLQ